MRPESQIVQVSRVPGGLETWPGAGPAPAAVESPLAKLHARLKGRYVWAVLLAMIGGVLGGMWGFHRGDVQYEGTGMISVKTELPIILSQTEQNAPMPNYAVFLGTQMTRMQSNEVIEAALKDPAWAHLDRPGGTIDMHAFAGNVTVINIANTDLIKVIYKDRYPAAAAAGVNALQAAYISSFEKGDKRADKTRLDKLREHREQLESELKKKYEDILIRARPYGTDVLTDLYTDLLKRVGDEEDQWRRSLWLLEANKASLEAAATTQPGTQFVERVQTPEEIAKAGDPRMEQYLQARRDAEQMLRIARIHKAPEHPEVINLTKGLAELDKTIATYAEAYRANHFKAIIVPTDLPGGGAVTSLAQLAAQEKRLRELLEPRKKELVQVGHDNLELVRLNTEVKETRAQLEEANTRIRRLIIENGIADRIEIVSNATIPGAPASDSHFKFACLGSFGGAMAGFALVAMLGFVDRRFRRMDDVHRGIHGVPVLGMMPRLPVRGADSERAAVAVHCVHQLRTRLQVSADLVQPKVIAITSHSSGEGKTSLAMALGLSFAGSNARVLLMDFDVTGGHLSRRLEPIQHVKLGQILLQKGVVSQAQLDQGLASAKQARTPLGQVLVGSGAIDEQTLTEALAAQAPPPGLPQALAGLPLATAARATKVPNLWLLHSGAAGAVHPGRVPIAGLRRILDEAREQFDVVLVDTGPCPGSLEASLVMPHVDAVVAVVSSGTREDEVTAMLAHVKLLKGHVAGVVFNRADIREARTYSRGSASTQPPLETEALDVLGRAAGSARTAPPPPVDGQPPASTDN